MGPMNGWSAVGGQTTSAYVGGQFDFNDGVMGHTVTGFSVPLSKNKLIDTEPMWCLHRLCCWRVGGFQSRGSGNRG